LFINGKEIVRFTTSKTTLSYFESFSPDLNQHFGKRVMLVANGSDIFEIDEDISGREIAVELWNHPEHAITRYLNFDCILGLEITAEK
jgi:hypothetical protein